MSEMFRGIDNNYAYQKAVHKYFMASLFGSLCQKELRIDNAN